MSLQTMVAVVRAGRSASRAALKWAAGTYPAAVEAHFPPMGEEMAAARSPQVHWDTDRMRLQVVAVVVRAERSASRAAATRAADACPVAVDAHAAGKHEARLRDVMAYVEPTAAALPVRELAWLKAGRRGVWTLLA